jgi:hypothetical protein
MPVLPACGGHDAEDVSVHVPAHTRVQRCPLHIQTLIPERRSKSQSAERRTTKPHSSQTPNTHPIVRFSKIGHSRSAVTPPAAATAAFTSSNRGSCFSNLPGESRSIVNPDSGSRLANIGARDVTPLARTRASFRRYRAGAAGRFFAPDRRSSLSTGRSSPQFVPKRTAR